DLIAFVDADCVAEPGWHHGLAGLFDDGALALAAPRVLSVERTSTLSRYERAYSPLDMGDAPSLVGPGRPLTYVPSAALVARRSALLSVRGFDGRLQVGEDVDLIWRLHAAGWRVRYSPDARVRHEPRGSLPALARQRFRYGLSAARLEVRHPGMTAPLRRPRGTGRLRPAATAGRPSRCEVAVVRYVARGHLQSAKHVARVLTREWLPLTLVAAVGSSRARRLAALAVAVDLVAARRVRAPLRDVPANTALRALDHLSYSAG